MKTAQTILRKDPEFWDMRAALTAFHWGIGDLDKAEDEWQTLCTSGRGFGQSESAESVRSFGGVAQASKLYGTTGKATTKYRRRLEWPTMTSVTIRRVNSTKLQTQSQEDGHRDPLRLLMHI